MVVERMGHMLPIAVVVIVGTSAVGQEVGLVVLVVGVRQFEMTGVIPGIPALQSRTISVEMIVVSVAFAGAEEIASPPYQRQLVGSTPCESFLDVVGLLSIETAQVGVIIQYGLVVG